MKNIVVLCVIALIVCCTTLGDAAVFIEKGDCKPGDVWTEPGCVRKRCANNGKQIEGATCGVVGCPPGINLKDGDQSKSYPDCCPACDF